jgi:predicted HTH domain antitoxin
MKAILDYPDDLPLLLKQSRKEFEAELPFLAAAKLYELGRLSSGKAAELAGMSRAEFLHRLGHYGIPAINLSGDEVLHEVDAA